MKKGEVMGNVRKNKSKKMAKKAGAKKKLPKLDLTEFVWNTDDYKVNQPDENGMERPHRLDGENVDFGSLEMETPETDFFSTFEEAMLEVDNAAENNRQKLCDLFVLEAVKRGAKEKEARAYVNKTWKRMK